MYKMITEEEMWMVYDYITLSIVSDVIDYEVSKIAAAGFKFPAIIKSLYLQKQNGVFEQIVLLRILLTGRGIKIYEKNKKYKNVEYKFICRTYEHKLNYKPETLRIQSIMKLCELLEVDPEKCEVAIWQEN